MLALNWKANISFEKIKDRIKNYIKKMETDIIRCFCYILIFIFILTKHKIFNHLFIRLWFWNFCLVYLFNFYFSTKLTFLHTYFFFCHPPLPFLLSVLKNHIWYCIKKIYFWNANCIVLLIRSKNRFATRETTLCDTFF